MSKVISGFPGIGKSYYTKNNSLLLVSDNWDNWITDLEQQKGCTHLVLGSNTYLKDVL